MKFYAVQKGLKPGVYTNWIETSQQVNGFSGAIYKSFPNLQEAQNFVYQNNSDKLGKMSATDEQPTDQLIIYTDGSFKDEIGGYGCAIIFPSGQVRELYGHVPTTSEGYPPILGAERPESTDIRSSSSALRSMNGGYPEEESVGIKCTNNRAELYAIASAITHLLFLNENMKSNELPKRVIIYSDSEYSINVLTKWLPKWRSNGWKTSAGKQVENQQLIKFIDATLKTAEIRFLIIFKHVYSHSGIEWNERVDQLADLGRLNSELIYIRDV